MLRSSFPRRHVATRAGRAGAELDRWTAMASARLSLAQNGVMKLVDYERHEVGVGDWDPTALEVFAFVRGSLAVALPGL